MNVSEHAADELSGFVQNVESLYARHEAIRTSDGSHGDRRNMLVTLYADAIVEYRAVNRPAKSMNRQLCVALADADLDEWHDAEQEALREKVAGRA